MEARRHRVIGLLLTDRDFDKLERLSEVEGIPPSRMAYQLFRASLDRRVYPGT